MIGASEIAAAEAAAAAWGGLAAPPRPVHLRENAVFDVNLRDGRRIALRLHRPGYRSPARLTAELRWTEALADAAFPCPWPQRTVEGGLLSVAPDGRLASAVQWVEGVPLGQGATMDTGAFRALGALLADLHLTSDAVAPAGLDRPRWDRSAFCDPDAPIWGRFWDNPALSPAERKALLAARARLAERLASLPAGAEGLIHADVLPDNVLVNGTDLVLIDFDDGGYGDRRYDLATALIQHGERAEFSDLATALVDGYADAGGAGVGRLDEIDVFIACRAMASCGWATTRLQAGDTRLRLYAARALRWAGWLEAT